MKKLFFIIIISLIYVSCEKIIPFEGDITIPKLVINSIFESDSSFKVHVSSSRSVIDTASFKNIEDADESDFFGFSLVTTFAALFFVYFFNVMCYYNSTCNVM